MKRWILILIGLIALSVTPAYAQTAYLSRIILDGSVIIDTGTVSPEGSVTASVGSIYMQRNGASGFVFWKKESGSGNTGWVRDPALAIGAAGTILRSDGTNWVATTATYPATAGADGTFLRSNGTNWITSTLILPGGATINSGCFAYAAHTIACGSIGLAGGVIVNFQNTTSTSFAQIGAVGNAGDGAFYRFNGTAFASTGTQFADGATLSSTGAGGFSIAAEHPSGVGRVFTGGSVERWRTETDGSLRPNQSWEIFPRTSDGADNQYIRVSGGGSVGSESRGAWVSIAGNEAGSPGAVSMGMGNAVGSKISIFGPAGTEVFKFSIDGNNGQFLAGKNGVTNAVFNSEESMHFNVDSDNTGSLGEFSWGINRATDTGGTRLMTLATTGALMVGTATANGAAAGDLRVNDAYYSHGRTAPDGYWTSVAYNAANFTASSGTWTVDAGDQAMFKYALVGKTMHVAITLVSTDVSATPTDLLINIPGGCTAAYAQMSAGSIVVDAGAAQALSVWQVNSGTQIYINKNPAIGAWTATSGDNTEVRLNATFEVTGC